MDIRIFLLGVLYSVGILGPRYTCAQEDENCDRNFLGRLGSGTITHPNYPFDYKKHRRCVLYIYVDSVTPPRERTICFTFHRFQLQDDCFGSHLRYHHEAQEHRYCGDGWWDYDLNDQKANVFSPVFCWPIPAGDTEYSLVFNTDVIGEKKGFYANYGILDQPFNSPKIPPAPVFSDNSSFTNSTLLPATSTMTTRLPAMVTCDFDPSNCPQYCYHGYEQDGLGCETCDCVRGTTAPCSDGDYTCFNRDCIPNTLLCNGQNDCGDNSDEDYLHARCPGTQGVEACNFDDDSLSLCHFEAVNWFRDNYSAGGPRFDHTTGVLGEAYFAYTSYAGIDTLAYLNSTQVPIEKSSHHCLSFWYFMAAYVGTLSVYVTMDYTPTGHQPRVWYRVDDHGTQWRHGEIDIPTTAFPMIGLSFVGEKGIMVYNNLAIDDISLLPGPCLGDDVSCTFELTDCGWHDDNSGDFSWKRKYGPTDTEDTGPTADVSGEGFYAYAEASTNQGKTARLISRGISWGSGSKCLKFWYHMYGRDVGSLAVSIIYFDGEEHQTPLWMRQGDHGNRWMEGQVSLSYFIFDGPFQLVFEANIGNGILSDIAIDDVVFKEGLCSTAPPSTTTTTAGPPPTCHPDEFLCDYDRCIPSRWVCDGSLNCDDGTDEADCDAGVSIAVIVAIAASFIIIIVIIIISLLYCQHKKILLWGRGRRRRRAAHSRQGSFRYGGSLSDFPVYSRGAGEEQYGAENLALDPIGVPPPPYSVAEENASYAVAGHGAMGLIPGGEGNVGVDPPRTPSSTLTISLTTYDQEPPPPYQIAIIATPPTYSAHTPVTATPPGYTTLPGNRPRRGKNKPRKDINEAVAMAIQEQEEVRQIEHLEQEEQGLPGPGHQRQHDGGTNRDASPSNQGGSLENPSYDYVHRQPQPPQHHRQQPQGDRLAPEESRSLQTPTFSTFHPPQREQPQQQQHGNRPFPREPTPDPTRTPASPSRVANPIYDYPSSPPVPVQPGSSSTSRGQSTQPMTREPRSRPPIPPRSSVPTPVTQDPTSPPSPVRRAGSRTSLQESDARGIEPCTDVPRRKDSTPSNLTTFQSLSPSATSSPEGGAAAASVPQQTRPKKKRKKSKKTKKKQVPESTNPTPVSLSTSGQQGQRPRGTDEASLYPIHSIGGSTRSLHSDHESVV